MKGITMSIGSTGQEEQKIYKNGTMHIGATEQPNEITKEGVIKEDVITVEEKTEIISEVIATDVVNKPTDLSTLDIKELRVMAKEKGIKSFGLSKDKLIEQLSC